MPTRQATRAYQQSRTRALCSVSCSLRSPGWSSSLWPLWPSTSGRSSPTGGFAMRGKLLLSSSGRRAPVSPICCATSRTQVRFFAGSRTSARAPATTSRATPRAPTGSRCTTLGRPPRRARGAKRPARASL
eukprot:Amastigsp_a1111_10.p3 type:complete len:131 gc:universal Amastigsp_a1111_10:622-1014(+)